MGDSTTDTIRLKRNPAAMLWWGTGGGLGAAFLALLLAISIVANVSFYLEGERASIVVIGVFLIMLAVTITWLTGRVELQPDGLVAGSRLFAERTPRAEVKGVRIGQVEPIVDEIFGVQILVDEQWKDLRLGKGLEDDVQRQWTKEISVWAGCDVSIDHDLDFDDNLAS